MKSLIVALASVSMTALALAIAVIETLTAKD